MTREDRYDFSVPDVDGAPLREHDEVTLAAALPVAWVGICPEPPPEVPCGTQATIILLVPEERLLQLECYIGERWFVFAEDDGSHLRLLQTREVKLAEFQARKAN